LFSDDLTEAFTVLVGKTDALGVTLNNHYAPVTLAPAGAVLIGQLRGMLRLDPL
jgi:hypothetical protein